MILKNQEIENIESMNQLWNTTEEVNIWLTIDSGTEVYHYTKPDQIPFKNITLEYQVLGV